MVSQRSLRSSAANIPVNLDLAERLGVNPSTASVSIPLGATVNMAGAAVTITVLTLATVHTLGIHVDLATMIILSVVATISACGASGVAGGSLLLIQSHVAYLVFHQKLQCKLLQ